GSASSSVQKCARCTASHCACANSGIRLAYKCVEREPGMAAALLPGTAAKGEVIAPCFIRFSWCHAGDGFTAWTAGCRTCAGSCVFQASGLTGGGNRADQAASRQAKHTESSCNQFD